MKTKTTSVLGAVIVLAASPCFAALTSITSYTFDSSQNLTSFTVTSGTYTGLNSSTSASGASDGLNGGTDDNTAPGNTVGSSSGGDSFFNFWANGANEVDGFDGALSLNLNAGPGNVGESGSSTNGGFAEFQFGTSLAGQPGIGNDIFIFELSGNDAITVEAIDGSGNVIGDKPVSILTGNWGTGSLSYQFYIDNDATLRSSTPITGVAFDVEDFFTGAPSPIQGIRWTGSDGLDPVSVGYTIVPEPGSSLLACIGALVACGLRRRI